MNGPIARRTDAAMRAVCALGPACLAAARAVNVADAAHDGGVARILALGPEPWRSLDVATGALLSVLPLGTRAERAALGGALVVGVAGVALYAVVRGLLGECAQTRHLRFVVAAIATTSPLVGAPWQIESGAVGGSVVGACLILTTVALAARAAASGSRTDWLGATATLGLAAGYEPLVGATALAGFAAYVGASQATRSALREAWDASRGATFVGAFVAGLAPFLLALVHTRASGASLATALGDAWLGERGAAQVPAGQFFRDAIGVVLFAFAVVGTGLAILVARARPHVAALVAIAIAGALAARVGAPLGPTRYGAPILAGTAATFALAAVAMQALVRAIAAAPVPFARASAAMVVVLELVVPVDAADDTLDRTRAEQADAASVWDDIVWGALPPNTLVIADDPRVHARAVAGRAEGALRGDLVVVVADANSTVEWRAFEGDKTLLPLWRDLALTGVPTEASLSALSSTRPVAMAYEPRWGYAIGRHLDPLALWDRFEPEPRGTSDRRRALDTFAADRQRLAILTAADPELSAASAALLRARASAAAEGGDRELAARTLLDLRAFAR